jgi:hypothetical protein
VHYETIRANFFFGECLHRVDTLLVLTRNRVDLDLRLVRPALLLRLLYHLTQFFGRCQVKRSLSLNILESVVQALFAQQDVHDLSL